MCQFVEIDPLNRVRIQLNGYWFAVKHSGDRGWGMFADEDVPFGHWILQYCGVVSDAPVKGKYVMKWGPLYIDADPEKGGVRVGNVLVGSGGRAWMGLINEPNPNQWITCKPGNGTNGLPVIKVVQPGGLKKGDELLMCYGDGRVYQRGCKHNHSSSRCYGPRKITLRAMTKRSE